ncbi:hypothetical protein LGL05_25475, partial [Clostridium tagluense]|uniref:hypothetical protein n=1 Tax=Clostridium tagluense TaxID=360422 RepID=UPI001CF1F468
IPNRSVKLQCANGTAGVTLWESRSSPGKQKTTKSNLVVFILRKYNLGFGLSIKITILHLGGSQCSIVFISSLFFI